MMYNLADGDFAQIGYMDKNWTIVDLYYWAGIKNYVIVRENEKNERR